MDPLGPFSTFTSGNKWIVMSTEYLIRFAETKVILKGRAAEVPNFIVENILLRHGTPEVITDTGTAFTAELTQAIIAIQPDKPEEDNCLPPADECFTKHLTKTLAFMIAMCVDVEHKTWYAHMRYVTFAHKTAVKETTQITLLKLVYGRNPMTMRDAMLPHVTDEEYLDVATYLQRGKAAR
ncbi:uncharacterized protein [Dermacentor albipictus]|uniref:uncharacterized protein n=1 Tax=Dermacentor albipictus TaxID=60249 RepID=UPI0031FBCBC9